MERAHAPPDQDQDHHHILHSSMPILKQQQEEQQDHHQEQEQEQLKKMSIEEQDLNLPRKEQEDDMSSLHVPELTKSSEEEAEGGRVKEEELAKNSEDEAEGDRRKEEEVAKKNEEGGRRKEEEPTKNSGNTTVTSSSSSRRSGRERLQRHRKEVAGHVWIPEIWGQEELLKDWIDCSQFDACLVPTGVVSARAALVHQAAATPNSNSNSSPITIDNSPSTRPAGPPS